MNEHITIFTLEHNIFMTIPVDSTGAWDPSVDEEFSEKHATKDAKYMLSILNDTAKLLSAVYPQPSIGRSKLALELWLYRDDKQMVKILQG